MPSEICIPELDIDPYDEKSLLDPYPMHEQIRESGPVVWLEKYQVFACGRHQEVHTILNNWETFISSAGVGLTNFNVEPPSRPKSLILEQDPPFHTQTRAILSRILSPKTVTIIREIFTKVAEDMLDECLKKGSIDGIKDLARPYPLKVFPDAVGLEEEGRENLLLYGDMIFNSMGPKNELAAKSVERAQSSINWVVAHCMRNHLRPGGFGDQIYQAADAGELDINLAPALVRAFLAAGVDTTINALGNALFCLAHHPEQYAKLHADPSLARPAFEEGLRYESTAQTFYRTTSRNCEIAGASVPADSKVLLFLAAANRDPRKWEKPNEYLIERRPSGHMAFGSGIHGCVGQVIARLEGEVVLTALAKRVKRIEVIGQHTRRLSNTLRALESLPLKLIAA